MQWTKFLKSSGLAALAAALVIPSASAQAQNGQWRNHGDRAAVHQDAQRGHSATQIDRHTEPRAAHVEQRGDRAAHIDGRSERAARQIGHAGDQRALQLAQGHDGRQGNHNSGARDHSWNGRGSNDHNDRSWRGNNRGWQGNDRHLRDNYYNQHRDAQRDWRDYRRDQRRWDRLWRNDNRYDWYGHRQSNRGLYSPGRYHAPYRSYSYRRPSIGIHLNGPFYASRYWITDPWQYRLPAVYGSYRWVRYYDDVLLVDIYTGRVVDVIHNFFW